MTRVIIVRHGQSTYNIERRIQGRADVSTLTERGRSDASKVGKALTNISFKAIYTSPLQRAKQTAEIIHSELANEAVQSADVQISELLREIDLPLWEKLLTSEVKEKFPKITAFGTKNPRNYKC